MDKDQKILKKLWQKVAEMFIQAKYDVTCPHCGEKVYDRERARNSD